MRDFLVRIGRIFNRLKVLGSVRVVPNGDGHVAGAAAQVTNAREVFWSEPEGFYTVL